ncbi:hypothetical protein [Lacinutrix salivirga]
MAQRGIRGYGLLIIGLIFISVGAYRFYNHFVAGAEYTTLRLMLAAAFLLFGGYYIYKYFNDRV